jgi:hypothetical protein
MREITAYRTVTGSLRGAATFTLVFGAQESDLPKFSATALVVCNESGYSFREPGSGLPTNHHQTAACRLSGYNRAHWTRESWSPSIDRIRSIIAFIDDALT